MKRYKGTLFIYLIPIVFMLWANIKSSMQYSIAILLVEAAVGTLLYRDRKLWLVLGLSLLGTLANPWTEIN